MENCLTTKVEDFTNTNDLFSGVTLEQIEAIGEIEMLTEIIPKNMITCIHSVGGQGKSTLIGAMVNKALNNDKTLNTLWFDYDNALYRNKNLAETLLTNHSNRFQWIQVSDKNVVNDTNTKLMSADLSNTIIVVDALQGLFNRTGMNINDATDAGRITDMLRNYADKGATVIMIHHSNKQDKDGWSTFRGSAVIQDSVDNLFQLAQQSRTEDELTVAIDISAKFSFLVKDASVKNYTIDLNLDYITDSIDIKPELPKGISEEMISNAIEIVEENTCNSLAEAETRLMTESTVGKNKAKKIYQYLVSDNRLAKEVVAERRAIYKIKGTI